MTTKPTDKRYCIRTFRGYECSDTISEAERIAQDMIMDIMVDDWSKDFWWALIIDNHTGNSQLWNCPRVGLWGYTEWLRLT